MTDAETLTRALGGEWRGQFGNAPCPVCQPERRRDQRALSLRCEGGRLLVFCHKGGCEFRAIVEAAGFPPDALAVDLVAAWVADAKRAAYGAEQLAKARRLWGQSKPINGTKGEAYLRERYHLRLAAFPALGSGCLSWAERAMAIGDGGRCVNRRGASHLFRESRRADFRQRQDDARPLRRGRCSPVRGPRPACRVRERGLETGLSLASGLLSGPATIWAALSTSGIRGLRLPAQPGALVIAADGDDPGRTAAQALAESAYARGWQVSLLTAPDGQDWNDFLIGKAAA